MDAKIRGKTRNAMIKTFALEIFALKKDVDMSQPMQPAMMVSIVLKTTAKLASVSTFLSILVVMMESIAPKNIAIPPRAVRS